MSDQQKETKDNILPVQPITKEEADRVAEPIVESPILNGNNQVKREDPMNFQLPCCNQPACPSNVHYPRLRPSIFNEPTVSALIIPHELGVRCPHCKTYQSLFMLIDQQQGLPFFVSRAAEDPNPPKVMPATLAGLAQLQQKVKKH